MAIKQTKPQPGYALRYRLTGAVVIVTFIVVVTPLLLPSPEKGAPIGDHGNAASGQDGLAESPPAEPATAIDTGKTRPQSGQQATFAVSREDRESGQGNERPRPGGDRTGQQAAVAPAAGSTAPGGQAWFVRVGTYVNIRNVDSISKLLADHGLDVRHTEVQTSSATGVRVWLGPYYDREKAEQARLQAKNLTHEKVYVTEQAP